MSKPKSLNAFHWRAQPSQLVDKERPPRIVRKVDAVSTTQVNAYSKAIASKVVA